MRVDFFIEALGESTVELIVHPFMSAGGLGIFSAVVDVGSDCLR